MAFSLLGAGGAMKEMILRFRTEGEAALKNTLKDFKNGLDGSSKEVDKLNTKLTAMNGLDKLTNQMRGFLGMLAGVAGIGVMMKWAEATMDVNEQMQMLDQNVAKFNTTGRQFAREMQNAMDGEISLARSAEIANRALAELGDQDKGTIINVAKAATILADYTGQDAAQAMTMLADSITTLRTRELAKWIPEISNAANALEMLGMQASATGDEVEKARLRTELINLVLESTSKMGSGDANPFVKLKVAAADLATVLGLAIFTREGQFNQGVTAITDRLKEMADWVDVNHEAIRRFAENAGRAALVLGGVYAVGSLAWSINQTVIAVRLLAPLLAGPVGLIALIAGLTAGIMRLGDEWRAFNAGTPSKWFYDLLRLLGIAPAPATSGLDYSGGTTSQRTPPPQAVSTSPGYSDAAPFALLSSSEFSGLWDSVSHDPNASPAVRRAAEQEARNRGLIPPVALPSVGGGGGGRGPEPETPPVEETVQEFSFHFMSIFEEKLRGAIQILREGFMNFGAPVSDMVQQGRSFIGSSSSELFREEMQRRISRSRPRPTGTSQFDTTSIEGLSFGIEPSGKNEVQSIFESLGDQLVDGARRLGESIGSGDIGGVIQSVFNSLSVVIQESISKSINPAGAKGSLGTQMLAGLASGGIAGLFAAGAGMLISSISGKKRGETPETPAYFYMVNINELRDFMFALPTSFYYSGRASGSERNMASMLNRTRRLGYPWDVAY